jgi:thymidylate kinase
VLISLRGTNGSGKSTVIKALFEACPPKRKINGVLGIRLPEAYELSVPKCKKPVFVLGPYVTACGGCDRLIPFDIIPPLIEKYAKRGHVIFEGVIVASIYGQVGALMEKYKKQSVMLFLDTTLEECIERVQSRRDKRDDDREFNPDNLKQKFKATQRVKEKVTTDGIMRVETAPSDTAHKKIIKLLQEDLRGLS